MCSQFTCFFCLNDHFANLVASVILCLASEETSSSEPFHCCWPTVAQIDDLVRSAGPSHSLVGSILACRYEAYTRCYHRLPRPSKTRSHYCCCTARYYCHQHHSYGPHSPQGAWASCPNKNFLGMLGGAVDFSSASGVEDFLAALERCCYLDSCRLGNKMSSRVRLVEFVLATDPASQSVGDALLCHRDLGFFYVLRVQLLVLLAPLGRLHLLVVASIS
jgi:hypothetical protein